MKSEAAAAGNKDLQAFASAFGLLFIEEHQVK